LERERLGHAAIDPCRDQEFHDQAVPAVLLGSLDCCGSRNGLDCRSDRDHGDRVRQDGASLAIVTNSAMRTLGQRNALLRGL
jgi:hypothetical protein